jgi:hypothetical protein
MDFLSFTVQRRNVRGALDDKLSIVEVHRVQCRINEQEAQLPGIWQ